MVHELQKCVAMPNGGNDSALQLTARCTFRNKIILDSSVGCGSGSGKLSDRILLAKAEIMRAVNHYINEQHLRADDGETLLMLPDLPVR